MKNNSYEEARNKCSVLDVDTHHANLMKKWILPFWVLKLECPYCKEKLLPTSIRSISIKLNPRNIGDICVEFLCQKCLIGNTLYFEKSASDMEGFIDLINPNCTELYAPNNKPITEEEMYKQKYHNTVDNMIQNKEA